MCVSQWELCTLWSELQRDKPELLGVLEEVLSYTVSHLQDALKERDNLEQALRRSALIGVLGPHCALGCIRNYILT